MQTPEQRLILALLSALGAHAVVESASKRVSADLVAVRGRRALALQVRWSVRSDNPLIAAQLQTILDHCSLARRQLAILFGADKIRCGLVTNQQLPAEATAILRDGNVEVFEVRGGENRAAVRVAARLLPWLGASAPDEPGGHRHSLATVAEPQPPAAFQQFLQAAGVVPPRESALLAQRVQEILEEAEPSPERMQTRIFEWLARIHANREHFLALLDLQAEAQLLRSSIAQLRGVAEAHAGLGTAQLGEAAQVLTDLDAGLSDLISAAEAALRRGEADAAVAGAYQDEMRRIRRRYGAVSQDAQIALAAALSSESRGSPPPVDVT